MSSHYIYISCSADGCDTSESIYTGNIITDEFDSCAWEGETISALCLKHGEES